MRNKFLFSIVGAAILGIATLCYAQYQTKVYLDSGGDRQVIASGGEIDILGQVSASWSGGNVTLTVYPPGSTTVSSAAGTVTYFAVGTP